jgi:hypothetical protein
MKLYLERYKMAFDNPPIFAEAGEYFHVSYDAFDAGEGLGDACFLFENSGADYFSISDDSGDGSATGPLDFRTKNSKDLVVKTVLIMRGVLWLLSKVNTLVSAWNWTLLRHTVIE